MLSQGGDSKTNFCKQPDLTLNQNELYANDLQHLPALRSKIMVITGDASVKSINIR